MREVIFRGKRIDNGEWAFGSYCLAETLDRNGNEHCIIEYAANGGSYRVDPSTIGQYTGLTDKNGKKIFENDIIDASKSWWHAYGPAGHSSPIIAVEWNDYHCGFDPFADYDCDCGVYIDPDKVEVIGNIHDNPELIKETKEDGNIKQESVGSCKGVVDFCNEQRGCQ